METNETKAKSTVRQTAEVAVIAYIAVKTTKGIVAAVRDGVCFVQARKAEKAEK